MVLRRYATRTLMRPLADAEHVLTLDISLPASRYSGAARVSSYFEKVLARIEALPGCNSAGGVKMYMQGSAVTGRLGTSGGGRPYYSQRNPD